MKTMMRRLLIAIFIAALVLPLAPLGAAAQQRIVVAQQEQKRTLWDMLFGNEAPKQTVRNSPQRTPGTTTRRSTPTKARQPARAAPTPPPAPDVDKAKDATRLAVFGDSLAIDLSKALERFYADDPNIVVQDRGVGSSGIVRDDFYDWPAAIAKAIAADDFDIAIIIVGINDRQNLRVNGASLKPLTDAWKTAYSNRLNGMLGQFQAANKPVIWVELPPMQAPTYSAAIAQIASLQRLAVFSAHADYVEIYDRFADENGNYVSFGPDLNGISEQMRKADGIHFTSAGSDKLAFYVSQPLKRYYQGGALSVAAADPLAGTDAVGMERPPFQGLGQMRFLEVAGQVMPLKSITRRAGELISAEPGATMPSGFALSQMMDAPAGRVDAFGLGATDDAGQAGGPAKQ